MPLPSSRLGPGLNSDSLDNKGQITTSWPTSDTTYAAGNLVNQNQVAEGPSIPPPQSGEFRVPRPSAFRISSVAPSSVGEIIRFTWLDAEKPITEVAGYRIFAQYSFLQNSEPTLIGSSSKSPCTARITADTVGTVVFYLQPYLLNGLTLPLNQCPTCTTSVTVPVPTAGTTPGGNVTTFNTTSTWTAPAGVTSAFVQCWGAGGNGGAKNTTAGGGGGGGGAYAAKTLTVVPATIYTVTVATGGSGPGNTSWFSTSSTVFADSGGNGTAAASPSTVGVGGAGGSAASSGGDTTSSGNAGQNGVINGSGGSSGGSAGLPSGGSGGGAGQNGFAPGGGAGGEDGIGSGPAGTGADGRVTVTYS